MNKLKVVLFPAWYPSKYDKMAGITIERAADALSDVIDVSVLYIHPESTLPSTFEVETERGKVLVVRAFFKKRDNRSVFNKMMNGVLYGIASIKGYRELTRINGRADLHHVHVLTRAAVLPLVIKLLSGIPFVITERWSRYLPEDGSYSGYVRHIISKCALRNSRGLSTVSSALKRALERWQLTHKNTFIIPNAVNTSHFKPSITERRGKVRFIHASCFHEDAKNIKGIIRAANELDREGYSFELLIAGHGRDFKEVEDFVSELDFFHVDFRFVGELTGDKLVRFFQEGTAFILFSNYETQGSVILEALCCGIPVIGSRVGGIPEFVNEKNGILVKPNDIAELKKAMLVFISGEDHFHSEEIRNDTVLNYSFSSIAQKYVQFYRKALEQ